MNHDLSCPMCGEQRLRLKESQNEVDIDGTKVSVPFRTHECESCGSNLALDEDLRLNARTMRQATKAHYGLLTGAKVRALRKRLGLNQEQAAQIFGGGPVAFSKYENDDVTQSEAMDRLLWLAGEFPQLVGCLARHLNVPLGGEASIRIERSLTAVAADDFSQFHSHLQLSIQSLGGFDEISTASNDKIYTSTSEDRPAERIAA